MQILLINNTQITSFLTINTSVSSVGGGVAGDAKSDITQLEVLNSKILVNITSQNRIAFGGVASYITSGIVSHSTLDINLNFLSKNNLLGGFVVDEPKQFNITNCQNSISFNGNENLTAGGVCADLYIT